MMLASGEVGQWETSCGQTLTNVINPAPTPISCKRRRCSDSSELKVCSRDGEIVLDATPIQFNVQHIVKPVLSMFKVPNCLFSVCYFWGNDAHPNISSAPIFFYILHHSFCIQARGAILCTYKVARVIGLHVVACQTCQELMKMSQSGNPGWPYGGAACVRELNRRQPPPC